MDAEMLDRYNRMKEVLWRVIGQQGELSGMYVRDVLREVVRPLVDDMESLMANYHTHPEPIDDVEDECAPEPMRVGSLEEFHEAFGRPVYRSANTAPSSPHDGTLPPEYRVGRQLGRTVYEGDELIGVMDSPELGRRVVAALNDRSRCAECGVQVGRCRHTNAEHAWFARRAEDAEAALAVERTRAELSHAAEVAALRGRIAVLEREMKDVVGRGYELHAAERDDLVAQLADAREQAVQNGQQVDRAMLEVAKARDALGRIERLVGHPLDVARVIARAALGDDDDG